MEFALFSSIVFYFTPWGSCQTGEQFTKLHQDLYKIHPNVRPVQNYTTPTIVNVSFHLLSINSYETANQILKSVGWLYVEWKDEYIVWNPNNYGGAKNVYPETQKVWRPGLAVTNTMKDLKPLGNDYVVLRADYTGKLTWFPAELFETFCRVDVTYFPFDFQNCQWEINALSDDALGLDLYPLTHTINLEQFVGNGEWELMSTRGHREVRTIFEKESVYLVYEVTLRRRPSLLVLTIMLPVLVLAVINVYVFAIPSESGQ